MTRSYHILSLRQGPHHISPITGMARLAGRILSSVHMGNFSPGYRAEISAVTEMNKARTFKFHPGDRAGVFILEHFQLGYRDFGRKNRDLGNRFSPPSHMNTSK